MNVLTNYQVIHHGGMPAFVLVPYQEFISHKTKAFKGGIPHEVAQDHILNAIPLIKAWRNYLGLTQQQVADKAGMLQSAYARLESGDIEPRTETLERIAEAFGLELEQIDDRD